MKEDSSFKEMIKDLKMSIKNEINRQKIFKKKAIFAEPELTRDLKCECLGNYTINLNYSFVPKYGSNCFDIHFYGYSTWNFDIIEKLFQDDEKEKNLSLNYYDGAPFCITYEFFHPIYIEYESISNWIQNLYIFSKILYKKIYMNKILKINNINSIIKLIKKFI